MIFSIINTNSGEVLYSSTKHLSIFSYFLSIDIGGRTIDSLIEWLKNDKYESAVLNYSYIKKKNKKLLIFCFFDGYEREEDPERTNFEIDIENLIEVAIQWQELWQKYFKIKISEENGKVYVFGSSNR